jgi:hypothetical protein
MSSWNGGQIQWDLWKLDQEVLERLARDAWMFEMPKPEQPGRLDGLRQCVGASLSTLGVRLIRRAASRRGLGIYSVQS